MNPTTPRPTPEVDALVSELRRLKSNTLEYPCEVALRDKAKELEQQRDELAEAIRNNPHHPRGFNPHCPACEVQRKALANLKRP